MWQVLRQTNNIFLSLLIFSAIFLLWPTQPVLADTNHNIRGWAYNSSYGYISMNCLDDNFAGTFTFTFPFFFNIEPCSFSLHGVHLDNNNNFSGQAWNSILGFIDFEGNDAPDTDFNIYCPSSCLPIDNCSACYNEDTGKVHGWAKIASSSIWIKLDDTSVAPQTSITNYTNANPGIFSGYASTTIGGISRPISFNCANDGSCGTNPYGVRIGPLEIRQLTAPNWSGQQVCDSNLPYKAVLQWNRRSGQQSAYQVVVSTQNSTSTGVVANVTASSTANQHIINGLVRKKPYYWFLRLWDIDNVVTPWRQFDTNIAQSIKDNLTDNNALNTEIGDSKTFSTYKHDFPRPAFTYSPSEVIIATSTYFINDSYYFNDADEYKFCPSGSVCQYLWWVVGDDDAVITTPTSINPDIVFARATSTSIWLQVTDDTYACSTSTSIKATYNLPTWKEIKPINVN